MSSEMPKCKITVLKRTINQDLIDEYLDDSYQDTGLCECFEEGEEFGLSVKLCSQGLVIGKSSGHTPRCWGVPQNLTESQNLS